MAETIDALINTVKYESQYKVNEYVKIAQFDCGNPDINYLFKKQLKRIHSTTYIFEDKSRKGKIVAFASICASSIQQTTDKGRIEVLPAVELKLFGVSKGYQNKKIENLYTDNPQKYSEYIFRWIITFIKSNILPILNVDFLILLSVPDERTLGFYRKMGMKPFEDNKIIYSSDFSASCIPMYLDLKQK